MLGHVLPQLRLCFPGVSESLGFCRSSRDLVPQLWAGACSLASFPCVVTSRDARLYLLEVESTVLCCGDALTGSEENSRALRSSPVNQGVVFPM